MVRAKKIQFPEDWTKLSDKEIYDNVVKLRCIYDRCELRSTDENTVFINNVKICQDGDECIINGKRVSKTSLGGELFSLVKSYLAPEPKRTFRQKLKDITDDAPTCGIASVVLIVVFSVGVCHLPSSIFRKEKAIKDKIEAYSATFPDYDETIRSTKNEEELQRAVALREQAKLKIAHYGDSLRAMQR